MGAERPEVLVEFKIKKQEQISMIKQFFNSSMSFNIIDVVNAPVNSKSKVGTWEIGSSNGFRRKFSLAVLDVQFRKRKSVGERVNSLLCDIYSACVSKRIQNCSDPEMRFLVLVAGEMNCKEGKVYRILDIK